MSQLARVNVTKMFTFDAAHMLPDYIGKCANLHGHTYTLIVTFDGHIFPGRTMVLDFAQIKELVQEAVIDDLDHACLNDIDWDRYGDLSCDFQTAGWEESQPTAENMVVAIASRIRGYMRIEEYCEAFEHAHLRAVHLYETANSYASWLADDQGTMIIPLNCEEVGNERGE
jgi:6-pyruvoyltetrahydropterin/6-carboxytetrahydropterin synthase